MSELRKNRVSLAIAILSATGLILSSYLTIIYYFSDGVATYCGAGWECDAVLNSRFSKLFGVPASLVGAAGYAVLIMAGIWGGVGKNRALIIGVASAGAGISAYLSWAEFFVIKQICPFCVASALIILAIWILSVRGASLSNVVAGVAIVVTTALVGYASAALSTQYGGVNEYGSEIRSYERDDFQRDLVAHLAKKGVFMYGSFRCQACIRQKEFFGKHKKKLNYVECHPEGKNADLKLCSEKKINAYPTWEIDGSFHKGTMTLEKLSQLSGYKKAPEKK